ncbi:MAG: hypothetical protein ACRD21_17375 [Vicinamibacteria bacterium]
MVYSASVEISVVRTDGHKDRFYVVRSNGSEVSWSFPTYGDGLPHDLVHLVVEAAFGVRKGIWKRVDEGMDIARVNAAANRKRGKAKYEGSALGVERGEVLLSEALAGIRWLDRSTSDEERHREASFAFDRAGLEAPPLDTCVAVRETLTSLGEKWRALAPKGALDFHFDPEAAKLTLVGKEG